jgi:diadenosine tetraphosphate (Ap4A) HIT family hydrolase
MAKWRDAGEWTALRSGTACWVCTGGGPTGVVVAESAATWVTTRSQVTCRGYLCVYAKRHVVEPYELPYDEMMAFFADAMSAARGVEQLFQPVKMNYEIHGNTIPHLHLHVFPRYVGDPFEGGPIRASELHVTHSDAEVDLIRDAVRAALGLR